LHEEIDPAEAFPHCNLRFETKVTILIHEYSSPSLEKEKRKLKKLD